MNAKKLFELLDKENELRTELNISPAYVHFSVGNETVFEEIFTFEDFEKKLRHRYIESMCEAVLKADFQKGCYAQTLFATIKFKVGDKEMRKNIDFFVDC